MIPFAACSFFHDFSGDLTLSLRRTGWPMAFLCYISISTFSLFMCSLQGTLERWHEVVNPLSPCSPLEVVDTISTHSDPYESRKDTPFP